MLSRDFPCHCGHNRERHINEGRCYLCWAKAGNTVDWKLVCHEFVPDNLRYLERESLNAES
jgi:hypothetical protein